ncbi:hypothetical protein JB92DRAFT_3093781 [Gautieria morchelliformis]|nr:hypothetical protein JB92DRAFT_3093781 [Gautieria morchelliformis]
MCRAVCVCTTVSGFGCMCPRRQRGQHRGRVLPLLVWGAVAVPTGPLTWRALHLLHLSLLTFLLLPAPPALPHRRPRPPHTSTTFPRAPTRPPQRFHRRVARRETAHAVREVVLEPIIQSMTLISGRPFIKPVYTLVGLEGTGFVLSSSTGAAWGTLFGSSQKLRADYVATALRLGLRALQGWWRLPVWVGWEGMTRPHEL